MFCQSSQTIPRTQTLANAAHARALLQRKCACGGSASLGGSCAECSKKERPPQVGPSQEHSNHSSHDFSRVRVSASNESQRRAAQPLANPLNQLFSAQDERTEKYAPDGVLVVFQSGTCQNGGAESSCHLDTGVFKLNHNDNTCCTKDCTAAHEAIHKRDFDGWGCCAAASKAYNAKGADQAKVVQTYSDWQAKVVPISECNAYSNDVTCADALAKTKDCSGAGKDTDCCKDIADYKTRYGALAKSNCAAAPKKAEPCPKF
jgi:hypothetical protein